jgi:hypothetical protein
MNHCSALLILLAAGAPLAVAMLLAVRSWRHVVARAVPVAAVPALVLVLVGPVGAKADLPWLGQHTVLELDAVGRVFLGFTSVLWLVSGWYARAYLARDAKTALKANVGFLPEVWAMALGVLLPLAAAGTTLKMARFLWLTWPPSGQATAESARGLWSPWLGLVAGTLAGVWWLPGALEVLPQKLSPDKLWDALWPLLFGSALALLGAWLRRGFSGDSSRWLPAGDMGVLIERLLARLQLRGPVEAEVHHGDAHAYDPSPAPEISPWSMRLKRAGESLARLEARLCSWPVAGALWLLLMGAMTVLLATTGR